MLEISHTLPQNPQRLSSVDEQDHPELARRPLSRQLLGLLDRFALFEVEIGRRDTVPVPIRLLLLHWSHVFSD